MTTPEFPAYDADRDTVSLYERIDVAPKCRDCGVSVGLPGDTLVRCKPCRDAHARFVQA